MTTRRTALLAFVGLALIARVGAAADLPAALVDPYIQVQVALSSDKFEGVTIPQEEIERYLNFVADRLDLKICRSASAASSGRTSTSPTRS